MRTSKDIYYISDSTGIWVVEEDESGLTPSREDIQITKRLKAADETLGIKLLDHIIFNHKEYFSFLEKREM